MDLVVDVAGTTLTQSQNDELDRMMSEYKIKAKIKAQEIVKMIELGYPENRIELVNPNCVKVAGTDVVEEIPTEAMYGECIVEIERLLGRDSKLPMMYWSASTDFE